jgi:hypothetical protein
LGIYKRKIQTVEGKRMNFKTTMNATPMGFDNRIPNLYSFGKEMFNQKVSTIRTARNTEMLEEDQEDFNTSQTSGSARVDFVYNQPKSLSIAMGKLGQKSV